MRSLLLIAIALVACSSKPAPIQQPQIPDKPDGVGSAGVTPAGPQVKKETMGADTQRTTVAGNTFMVPSGWTTWVQGAATFVETPEGTSRVVFVDVKAANAEEARDLAWAAYKPVKWKQLLAAPTPDKDGWSKITAFAYEVPPNEKRQVAAVAMFANEMWTVALVDIEDAVGEKRGGQFALVFGQLLPKGGKKESFAGKVAHPLDKDRLATLTGFIEEARKTLDIAGLSVGIIEKDKVVFSGGFGVRELGKPAKPDGDTKYIIASTTKALTTLMLAKLVAENKLAWDVPVTKLYPEFKLGDADTTSKVLVRHLICACTGMPRQDLEWLLEWGKMTPASAVKSLAGMQPTSKFGELFQYSNVMAAAAGFVAGHVVYPGKEFGAAYDEVMRTRVFEPLGMKTTTFDFKQGFAGNVAAPHAYDLDGKQVVISLGINNAVIPVRPAGGAWSTVNDLLKWVRLELAEGKLPDGKQYLAKDTLFARREKQVALGKDGAYGMGLFISKGTGVEIVGHGGDLSGYHGETFWLPEHQVGMVILTNSDRGPSLRGLIQRRLLEVLFDGNPEAAPALAHDRASLDQGVEVTKKMVTRPADATEAGKLAARYSNASLGEIAVTRKDGKTYFDAGEWKSEVGSYKDPSGHITFLTTTPGFVGVGLVVGTGDKKTLVLRDAQHEYVFTEK